MRRFSLPSAGAVGGVSGWRPWENAPTPCPQRILGVCQIGLSAQGSDGLGCLAFSLFRPMFYLVSDRVEWHKWRYPRICTLKTKYTNLFPGPPLQPPPNPLRD